MKLVDQWTAIAAELPEAWESVRLTVSTETPGDIGRAAHVLGSMGAGHVGDALVVTVDRAGGHAGPEAARRLFGRLDSDRVWALLAVADRPAERPAETPRDSAPSAVSSWETALAALPVDWSDALFELRLASTALLPRAALLCAPLNPTRDHDISGFVFRGSREAGYGVSTMMARQCCSRLDAEGIEAAVGVRRALSGSAPVATQGPTWLVAGKVL